jgi:hypothetical protein
MINLFGFIIGFFVVLGHSLTKEVAAFAAKTPCQSNGLCSTCLSFDLETFVTQKLKDMFCRGKFNSFFSGVAAFHCKRWMKALQFLLQSLR